jgi:hypothetical protein
MRNADLVVGQMAAGMEEARGLLAEQVSCRLPNIWPVNRSSHHSWLRIWRSSRDE